MLLERLMPYWLQCVKSVISPQGALKVNNARGQVMAVALFEIYDIKHRLEAHSLSSPYSSRIHHVLFHALWIFTT